MSQDLCAKQEVISLSELGWPSKTIIQCIWEDYGPEKVVEILPQIVQNTTEELLQQITLNKLELNYDQLIKRFCLSRLIFLRNQFFMNVFHLRFIRKFESKVDKIYPIDVTKTANREELFVFYMNSRLASKNGQFEAKVQISIYPSEIIKGNLGDVTCAVQVFI